MLHLTRPSAEYQTTRRNPALLPGLLLVILAHVALLYGLWSQRMIPPPEKIATLFVNFITASRPAEKLKTEMQPPKLKPEKNPKSRQLVAETPALNDNEPVAPSPPRVQETASVASPTQMPQGPVTLSAELSVVCPELSAPSYPPLSRRLGEEGKLVLRVELDEIGHIHIAQVINSSGHKRLDDAAMAAVKTWRCNPPRRNGIPVRAIALQPFNFVLHGE